MGSFILTIPFGSFLPFIISCVSCFITPLVTPRIVFGDLPTSPLTRIIVPRALQLSMDRTPYNECTGLRSALPLVPHALPLLRCYRVW